MTEQELFNYLSKNLKIDIHEYFDGGKRNFSQIERPRNKRI